MSVFREALNAYLTLRRSLGAKLKTPGRHLELFVDFLEGEGASVATGELALRWATAAQGVTPSTCSTRFADARRFMTYLRSIDPRTEVIDPELLNVRAKRRLPYLYNEREIERLLHHARQLPSPRGLRGITYATLFGLLAVSGLRHGEALALDRDDVDTQADLITVRHGKFGKQRFVPIHASSSHALASYARTRDAIMAQPSTPAFFINERGERVNGFTARENFVNVSRAIGLRDPNSTRRFGDGPRLHDLRHRLAVTTLLRWYREDRDVQRELPTLTTYLGHAHVNDTYWYLQAVPELLQLATDRAAQRNGTR